MQASFGFFVYILRYYSLTTEAMNQLKPASLIQFIVFPAITMLLGWGLRGHIGGGPFGAMIPGVMIALSIAILLRMPVNMAAMLSIFSVVGIGLGGEMTYGQTLGFLRNPDTVWWGTLGTTVKGGVWGLAGGSLLALGFLVNRIDKLRIIITLLIFLVGMLVGFKLINQPMVIYFSNPENPRPESWGALLIGSLAALGYLKAQLAEPDYRLIYRFTLLATLGGALGFGLGGFWIVLGTAVPEGFVFRGWWKAMEFTLGGMLGGAIGIAAWWNRHQLLALRDEFPACSKYDKGVHVMAILLTLMVGLLIYLLLPYSLDPIVEAGKMNTGFSMIGGRDIAIIFSNYAFFGLIMIAVSLYYKPATLYIAIVLTFFHASIDLIRDYYPMQDPDIYRTARVGFELLLAAPVLILTTRILNGNRVVFQLFLLMVWSTVIVSLLRMGLNPELFNIRGLSLIDLVFRRFWVDLSFLSAAIISTLYAIKLQKEPSVII